MRDDFTLAALHSRPADAGVGAGRLARGVALRATCEKGASKATKKAVLWALLVAGVLALAGCTDPLHIAELEEGLSTESDVRSRFGQPEKIWDALDMASLPLPPSTLAVVAATNARTLEYNRQPAGNVNFMITIASDGKMVALRQVLTPQNFERILPGQSVEQVRKMLGRPMKVTPYALKQQTDYDWRYLQQPNVSMIFSVTFDTNLKVVKTASYTEDSLNPAGSR